MATIFNRYVTKLITQLFGEYGNENSASEKKGYRDTLVRKIINEADKEKYNSNDESFAIGLTSIINFARTSSSRTSSKTRGLSSGDFEIYCSCANTLILEALDLFTKNEILNIKIDDLIQSKNSHKGRFNFVYILTKRVLLDYNINKTRVNAFIASNGKLLDKLKEFAKSQFYLDIESQKNEIISRRLKRLKNALGLQLESKEISKERLAESLDTISDQVTILLKELNELIATQAYKPQRENSEFDLSSILQVVSTGSNILYDGLTSLIKPGSGTSAIIAKFIINSLFHKILDEKQFESINENELAAMLYCDYSEIERFFNGSITTLVDDTLDNSNNSQIIEQKTTLVVERVDDAISDNDYDGEIEEEEAEEEEDEEINNPMLTSYKNAQASSRFTIDTEGEKKNQKKQEQNQSNKKYKKIMH